MSGFTFLSPLRLLLLLAVVGLGVIYLVFQRRRRSYAVRFTNLELLESVAPRRPGWRRHLAAAFQLLALVAMVFAFAEPAHDTKVPRERATVMLALDVSLSMEATDVKPDRITAAKAAAISFLDDVPKAVNVGLVTFAGSATVRVTPTTDRQRVANAIENAQLADGTAIGDAIDASLSALDDVPPAPDDEAVPAAIVLLSDGTTTMGTSNTSAAQHAVDAGVPVSTIAFGTPTGTVTLPDGEKVSVPVDAPALAKIAQTTGGKAYEASTQQQLTDVYASIGSSIGYDTAQSSLVEWFVFGGIVILLIGSGLALAWSNRLP